MKSNYKYVVTLLVIGVFLLSTTPAQSLMNIKVLDKDGVKYLSNTVVIKLKQSIQTDALGKSSLPNKLFTALNSFGFTDVKSIISSNSASNQSLNRIVVAEFTSDTDPFYIASKIKSSPDVEWAEPKFVREIEFVPNDPSYSSQYALSKISAALAWDISKGDTNVVIGIVDTGVDWDHPDLAANIWRNRDEIAGNGIDDDNNGYVDDIRGWDFGGLTGIPDNNPMEDQSDHGTHVAGIASAVSDNNTGVASIGFNCRLMPVKTSRNDFRNSSGDAYIAYGYEGVIYAADNGAKIINCSWGGSGASNLEQAVIDYVISKGSLIVAAAGNDNTNENFFPSAYNGVLSVASTTSTDSRSSFSNYGKTIDVAAPGSNIYNTWQNNTYATLSGTSMSSPLTAGLAGLVASRFPNYNPFQIAEQIRVNCDDISAVNPSFQYQLGKGRINARKALANVNSISVRGISFNYSDDAPGGNGNGLFESGETITLTVNFTNYLSPTSNLAVQLESRNNFTTIVNGNFAAGGVSTLQSFDNGSSKFSFTINANTTKDTELLFLLKYSDGIYNDFQWTGITANPTYATQSGKNIDLTITSKGTLGFNDYPANLKGKGYSYRGSFNQMFEGALITGTSAQKISDAARNGVDGSLQNNDFNLIQPFVVKATGNLNDAKGLSVFNDNNAGSNKIGITTYLNTYTFSAEPYKNFITLDYSFVNLSGADISNFYAALFIDWDIDGTGAGDVTNWDNLNNYGYSRNTTGGPANYNGVALLSGTNYGFCAFNNDGSSGSINLYDGFTDTEKWTSISNGVSKISAGPGDISNINSAGPFTIPANDTLQVGFAILSADSKSELDAAVVNARAKYQQIITDIEDKQETIPTQFLLEQNYPNPFNPGTKIRYSLPQEVNGEKRNVVLKVYDILGNEVVTLVNKEQSAGNYEVEFSAEGIASGIYLYKLGAGSFNQTKKMILLK